MTVVVVPRYTLVKCHINCVVITPLETCVSKGMITAFVQCSTNILYYLLKNLQTCLEVRLNIGRSICFFVETYKYVYVNIDVRGGVRGTTMRPRPSSAVWQSPELLDLHTKADYVLFKISLDNYLSSSNFNLNDLNVVYAICIVLTAALQRKVLCHFIKSKNDM